MSVTEINICKTIARFGILAFFCFGILARCASVGTPQGGPRDSLPPKVVMMTPAFGTTNFKDKRITIQFNEYVQLKDQQKEFFTSPFMKKKPTLMLRGRGIQIDLKEDLDSNQTYSLNFGKSVVDNNEGNPYTGLRYVFSTGDHIDSLLMSGYTTDAMTTDTVGNVYILFYDAKTDSIPQYDSTLLKSKPIAVGKSFPNGIFIAENLKPIDYRIYALEDNNGNLEYEPGVDRVAFLDSTYNPLNQPGFDIWYDTTRRYMQADPQIMMRMFMDKPFRRQTYTGSKRTHGNRIVLTFTAPHPDIKELSFEGIDPGKIVTEYGNSKRDTMELWFDSRSEDLPDTLRGKLIYMKHDSLFRLQPDTQLLKLGWRAPVKKEKEEKKKKEDDLPEPNPFKVRVAGGTTLNPEKNIVFEFDYPLTGVDSAAMSLLKLGEGDQTTPVGLTFRQDTLKLRKWTLAAPWEADQKYRLLIPAGVFKNTNGESNDTLRSEFTIESPEKYATLVLNIQGKTPESEYVVQVISPQGSVLKEVAHLKTGSHTLQYIDVGTVKIRFIEDLNGNGRWDTGSLVERRQPERVGMYVDDNNSEEITTKENWELVFDVDMNRIFGPVTMESMTAKINRDNEARLKAIAKKRAEDAANQKKQHNSGGGMGMGSMGGMGSMIGR
ncbi:Uncharacterised protein [Alistipes sp. cv1]|nr:Uncharacterised protein [Faecalibacterium prausnitzii]